MPIRITKFERYPGVDRNEFAGSVLNLCRTLRSQEKITSARYFWADGGNTVAMVVEGQPGCFDYNPTPDPNVGKASFAVMDLASARSVDTFQDAGLGTQGWDRSGRPTGTS